LGDCLEFYLDNRGVDNPNRHAFARVRAALRLDSFIIGSEVTDEINIDDRDEKVKYSVPNSQGFSQPNHVSHTTIAFNPGAEVELDFSGNRIQIIGVSYRDGGFFDVILDGKKIDTIDTFSRRNFFKKVFYDSGVIEEGEHNIKLVLANPSSESISHTMLLPPVNGERQAQHYTNEGLAHGKVDVERRIIDGGWAFEMRIPWSEIGGSAPEVNSDIRFGYKVYDYDFEGEDESDRSIGLRRLSPQVSINEITSNPYWLPKLKLLGAQRPQLAEVVIMERVHNDESWLEFEAMLPASEGIDSRVRLQASGLKEKLFETSFTTSLGGRFLVARQMLPNKFKLDDEILVEVLYGSKRKQKSNIAVPVGIKSALETIRKDIPDEEIEATAEYKRRFVEFYRDCALELAGVFGNKRNRDVIDRLAFYDFVYHLLYYENRDFLARDIQVFLDEARKWLDGEINEDQAKFYPQQPWKSKIDGSWQVFGLRMPRDGYDPSQPLRVALRTHYYHPRLFSRPGWALNQLDGVSGFLSYDTPWPEIEIILLGRGNSFAELADEEIQHVTDFTRRVFPKSANNLWFRGTSFGAEVMTLIASRHIDTLSLLEIHAPAITSFPDPFEDSEYDQLETYQSFLNSFYDKSRNLGNFPVRQVVAKQDERFLPGNLELNQLISNNSYGAQIDVIDGFTHNVPRPLWPDLRMPVKEASRVPNFLRMKQSSTRYGSAYGISVMSKEKEWRPFTIDYKRMDGETLDLNTENIDEIQIEFQKLIPQGENPDVNISVDQERFKIAAGDDIVNFQKSADGWERVEEDLSKYSKRPKLQGPIGDIEKEGFLIVYGTVDEEVSTILQSRALKIVDHRVGSRLGEWARGRFTVKADVDITNEDIETKNLWLIGGPGENHIVDRISGKLGLSLGADRVAIGDKVFTDKKSFLEMITLNPLNNSRYVYIEMGLSSQCYYADILLSRDFDFSVSHVDGFLNPIKIRGIFDSNWSVGEGSIVWDSSGTPIYGRNKNGFAGLSPTANSR